MRVRDLSAITFAAVTMASCGSPAVAPTSNVVPTVGLSANHFRNRTGTDTTERFVLSAQLSGVEAADRPIVLDSVLFDGVQVPARPDADVGTRQNFYLSYSVPSLFDHDGGWHRWTVFGTQPIGRIDAEVAMLRQRIELLEPRLGDTVKSSNGFWIRWTPSVDADALVSIIGPYFDSDSIPDTGAYFVEPFEPELTDLYEVGFVVLRRSTVVVTTSTSTVVRLRTTTADGVEAHLAR